MKLRRRRRNPHRLRGKAFSAFMLRARRAKHRRKNPHRKIRVRRRRRNPTVLMANTRMHPGRSLKRRRRRNPHRRMMLHLRPHRRRRRSNPHLFRSRRRIHRRRNPLRFSLRGAWEIAKLAIAGGAGVMTARIAAFYYTKWAADKVKGDKGKADPKHWRAIASEVLRILAMTGGTVTGHWLLGKVRVLGDSTRTAFLYGGLGESGRQLVGMTIKTLRPSTDLARVGLEGDVVEDDDGNQYLRTKDGQYYALTDASDFGEVVDADDLAGVVDNDDFETSEFEQAA